MKNARINGQKSTYVNVAFSYVSFIRVLINSSAIAVLWNMLPVDS